MPDRRQADRRETSKFQKKLSISLGNFIFIVIIFILLIGSIFACSYFSYSGYIEGYEKGYSDGYSEAYYNNQSGEDYDEDYLENYDEEYAEDYIEDSESAE